MSGPGSIDQIISAAPPNTAPASSPRSTQAPGGAGEEQLIYASRFAEKKFHPVILIGSAAAGKTVLLLSLLAYFKTNANDNSLSAFFDDDLFRSTDALLKDRSLRYFDLIVSNYIRGETDVATRLGDDEGPIFIPVRISGEGQVDLKFAFMESDGEWYHPNREKPGPFTDRFKPALESLLMQYADGISFIWVAPHVADIGPTTQGPIDTDEITKIADESLQGAIRNYQRLRRNNSAKDTHMLIVTKWDTHIPTLPDVPPDISFNLDRANDKIIAHEVDAFLGRNYSQGFQAFKALNTPGGKSVFRYTAGQFYDRKIGKSVAVSVGEDTLRSYPRDVWNWLYEGMLRGHDWDLSPAPLIPLPPVPKPTFKEWLFKLFSRILD